VDKKIRFHVPQGAADVSLSLLASQAEVEFIFSYADVHGIETKALVGRYTLDEAFHLLLEDTPLVAVHSERKDAYSIRNIAPLAELVAEPMNTLPSNGL
jgi:hypothetical protein